MNSTVTLYLKHKVTGALDIVTIEVRAASVHPELFDTIAAAAQLAARQFDRPDWTLQHQTTIDTPPSSRPERVEGPSSSSPTPEAAA